MTSWLRWTILAGAALLILDQFAAMLPAFAARPLLDQRQWDAYFALSARDVSVPGAPITVRLATYSGAPVDFAAYDADPVEVVVAGSTTARALDTSKRQPRARWRYTPPAGFRFQQSDVEVPIGDREGFYVVEARRGDATEQVWINRTNLGLVTKEGPLGVLVWCVDLRSGRAIAGARAEFLAGGALVPRTSDRNGLIEWRGPRPRFVLASWGSSKSFLSLLPQAPLPPAVVGVRLDRAVARAGEAVHVVGFARRRNAGGLRPAGGDALVTLVAHGRTLLSKVVRLDEAGAFSTEFIVPSQTATGDDAVIASAAGAVAGISLHVDAASDVTLSIATNCPCESDRDVDVSIVAMRMGAPAAGVPLELRAVRSPHIFAPGSLPETVRWATTLVLERTIRTDSAGHARFALPTPTDGLASTYGLSATTAGASASARVTVATAPFALAIEPDLSDIDVGEPAGFEVRGFDADDGSAKAAMPVTVRLAHGTAVQTKSVTLDERGRAHVVFNAPSLGSSIATAEASAAGVRALDATSITVAPIGGSAGNAASEPDVTVTLDRTSYRPGERLNVRARLDGTTGDALMTIDGARTYQARLGTVGAAGAQAALDLGDPQGEARATATLVRDGALVGGSERITIDGPGHLGAMSLTLDRPPNGGPARVEIHDGGLGGGTVAVSVTDGRPSEGASFEDAPGVLLGGGTTEQRNAPPSPAWHTFVTPARSRASDIYAAERPRKTLPELPPIGAATPRTRYWSVTRTNSHEVQVPVPAERGSYLISVLKIADDGDVGTASVAFTVR